MALSRIILSGILIITMVLASSAQTIQDKYILEYDSLQDLKIEQLDQNRIILENKLKAYQRKQKLLNDSLFSLNKSLHEHILILIEEKNALREKLEILDEEIESIKNEIATLNIALESNKETMRRVLWIAGPVLLLMLISLFLLLFIINPASRKKVSDQLSGLEIQLRKDLLSVKEELRKESKREFEIVRKEVQEERDKELSNFAKKSDYKSDKKAMKDSLKGFRKELQRELKDRIRKLGRKKKT